MAVAMIGPKFYAWDRNGKPLAFGKLYTYQARTNTPKATYRSEDQQVENTNPVILNGEGYADVYLSGSYKMVLKDKDENEIWSSDPVSSAQPEEWVNCVSATYLSPTSFKLSGNFVAEYEVGRRVRVDNNTSTYSYSTITSSVFAGNETTVVIEDAVVTTGIVETCVSIVGPESIPATDFKNIIPLYTDLVFDTVSDMVNKTTIGGQVIVFAEGQALKVNGENDTFAIYKVVTTSSDVSLGGDLWAKLLTLTSDKVSNSHEEYVGQGTESKTAEELFNYRPNRFLKEDQTVGSSLTTDFDEDLGVLSSIQVKLADVTVNNGTTAFTTLTEGRMLAKKFEVRGITDNDFNYVVSTESRNLFTASAQNLNAGEIATPFAATFSDTANYLRVKKGIGQGVIDIEYQHQEPVNGTVRIRKLIERINLDDGQPVRDYDLIMPQISHNTMQGLLGLVDATYLQYVIGCNSGVVQIVGHGSKLGDGTFNQLRAGTINVADLAATKTFSIPVISDVADVVKFFIQQKTPGQTTNVTKIVVEQEL